MLHSNKTTLWIKDDKTVTLKVPQLKTCHRLISGKK